MRVAAPQHQGMKGQNKQQNLVNHKQNQAIARRGIRVAQVLQKVSQTKVASV